MCKHLRSPDHSSNDDKQGLDSTGACCGFALGIGLLAAFDCHWVCVAIATVAPWSGQCYLVLHSTTLTCMFSLTTLLWLLLVGVPSHSDRAIAQTESRLGLLMRIRP